MSASLGVTRHSKEGVRLCEHIVRHVFGDIVHRVASVLLNRGRLPVSDIAKFAGLSLRSSASAVIVLMQHGLVRTSCFFLLPAAHQDAVPPSRDGLYDFDEDECLRRLQFGRILDLTASWHRLAASRLIAVEAIRLIMVHGRLPAQVLEAMLRRGDMYSKEEVERALMTLVEERLLAPTAPELQIHAQDVIHRRLRSKRADRQGVGDTKKILSRNEIAELERQAIDEIELERAELAAPSRIVKTKEKIGQKKKRADLDRYLAPNIPLQINHDRYGVLLRNELIVKATQEKWNAGTAVVMRATLDAAWNADSSLEDARSAETTVPSISSALSDVNARAPTLLMRGLAGLSNKSTTEHLRQYLRILAGDDQIDDRAGAFLYRLESNPENPYQVELERISKALRQAVLLDIVRQRLGNRTARVLMVVIAAQVASEETVRDCALMSYTEARSHLSALQRMALVEPQEVPKTAAKMRAGMPPNAEFHFWSTDPARAYNTLLASVHKSIANAMERLGSEMRDKRELLERQLRAQQMNKVHKLQAKDQADLCQLFDQRRRLALVCQRLSSVVFVLRELPGWPSTPV